MSPYNPRDPHWMRVLRPEAPAVLAALTGTPAPVWELLYPLVTGWGRRGPHLPAGSEGWVQVVAQHPPGRRVSEVGPPWVRSREGGRYLEVRAPRPERDWIYRTPVEAGEKLVLEELWPWELGAPDSFLFECGECRGDDDGDAGSDSFEGPRPGMCPLCGGRGARPVPGRVGEWVAVAGLGAGPLVTWRARLTELLGGVPVQVRVRVRTYEAMVERWARELQLRRAGLLPAPHPAVETIQTQTLYWESEPSESWPLPAVESIFWSPERHRAYQLARDLTVSDSSRSSLPEMRGMFLTGVEKAPGVGVGVGVVARVTVVDHLEFRRGLPEE